MRSLHAGCFFGIFQPLNDPRLPPPPIPIDELAVAAKNLRLVLQEIHNLHRRTLLVVVINLGGATRLHHALVNTLNGVLNVEEVHVHVAEGRSVVGERAVANGRSGNGGKPAVKDGILRCELGEHGQARRRKVRHDGVGVVDASTLRA